MDEPDSPIEGPERPVAYVDRTLEPLIARFLAHRREDADVIEAHVTGGDFKAIELIGHSIKGSGGGYGFPPLTALGTQIESAARLQDGAAVLALVRTMREYVEAVEVVLVDQ